MHLHSSTVFVLQLVALLNSMARKVKVLIKNGIDKREVGYYSTPSFIADYLTNEMLAINPDGAEVLDPATGKEELLKGFYLAGKHIESYDIIDYGLHEMSVYSQKNFIDVYADFVASQFFSFVPSKYDYMIANPPYNCHEIDYIKENKKWLNELFPVGAYNMYSMFLSAMISMAKDGCLIGVVIADSFLTSTYHSKLREQIFSTCSIHQIILCSTDLFWEQQADVRTCIMILQKGVKYQSDVLVADRPENSKQLEKILSEHALKKVSLDSIRLNGSKTANQILIDVDEEVVNLFHDYTPLGDVYKCVTCISTGNDTLYLSKEKKAGYTIPFYKNPASHKFVGEEDAYLTDSYLNAHDKDKNFMVRNKELLHREGIACSSMGLPFSAVYLPEEAVTGVNPTIFPPKDDINWMLSYLNSSLVTYLIRGVLIRSNMVTSGYVSCLPVLNFSDEDKSKLGEIADNVRRHKLHVDDAIGEIDALVFLKAQVSKDVAAHIKYFSKNLGKCV